MGLANGDAPQEIKRMAGGGNGHVPKQKVSVFLKTHNFLLPSSHIPISTLLFGPQGGHIPADASPKVLHHLLELLYILTTPFL